MLKAVFGEKISPVFLGGSCRMGEYGYNFLKFVSKCIEIVLM